MDIRTNLRTPGKVPPALMGKYKLEAFGYRLGEHKGEYSGGWEQFSLDMLNYCEQDVEVSALLYHKLVGLNYSEQALEMEHRVAAIIHMQETHGVAFNEQKAAALYAKLLGRRMEIAQQLKEFFGGWWVGKKTVPWGKTMKKWCPHPQGALEKKPAADGNRCRGYFTFNEGGEDRTPIEWVEFNPSSRDHIAQRLQKLYAWEPTVFTDKGRPVVDETTMQDLPYPPAKLILESLLLDKRIGAIAEGSNAWLKLCKNGRIHGAIDTVGTSTRRMSHFKPNLAQVPKVGSPYGTECRDLFEASPGYVLLGCDAAGIQLRALAHYMSPYDNGAYAKAVVEGVEADGTDVHSLNTVALGFDPKAIYTVNGKQQKGRNIGKTFIYAFIFGAGAGKVAKITGMPGKKTIEAFLTGLPALLKVKRQLALRFSPKPRGKHGQLEATTPGLIKALDGGTFIVPEDQDYTALCVLLQSAEAIIMKQALVILYDDLTARGWTHGKEYAFVLNVHDEWQIEVKEEIAHECGALARDAISKSGRHFSFQCALDGTFKIGKTWADTH